MAATREVHVDDVGTHFQVTLYDDTVVVDISGATVLEMVFFKPDETVITRTAVLVNDGTDGILEYVTIAGDLDQDGPWKLQAKVTLPAGSWSSDVKKFKVYSNLS